MEKITTPIANCPRTGLPRVARYTNHSAHANGSVSVNYSIDILDLQGDVFQADSEQGSIVHHSQAIYHGSESTEPEEMTPEMQALVTAVKPKITNILKTLNTPENE